jgi:hypothetical protein
MKASLRRVYISHPSPVVYFLTAGLFPVASGCALILFFNGVGFVAWACAILAVTVALVTTGVWRPLEHRLRGVVAAIAAVLGLACFVTVIGLVLAHGLSDQCPTGCP